MVLRLYEIIPLKSGEKIVKVREEKGQRLKVVEKIGD